MARQDHEERKRAIRELTKDLIKPGTVIDSQMGKVTVKGVLNADGGQGVVFVVSVDGYSEDYAMKIYLPLNEKKYDDIKSRFSKLVTNKPASLEMLAWPLCLVETSFRKYSFIGYVMRYVKGYKEANALIGNENVDIITKLKICVNISNAMKQIHEKQLSYKDLSDKNVLVNLNTGDIVIIDNDNVTDNYETTSMSGTPGYRAPEILEKESKAIRNTDLHSLAVLLFRIMFSEHPLHSKAYWDENQNDYDDKEEYCRVVYSEKACFMFKDPENLDKYIENDEDNQSIKQLWLDFSDEIRELFHKSFVDGLKYPTLRPNAAAWEKAITRALSKICFYSCSDCGTQNAQFYKDGHTLKCEVCDKEIPALKFACVNKQSKVIAPINIMQLYDGKEVYACYIDPENISSKELFKPIFISRVDKNGNLLIEPSSKNTVFLNNTPLEKGKKYPFDKGMTLSFDNKSYFCMLRTQW